MEDALLLLVMAAFFVFCYFVVVRLGRFTDVRYGQMHHRPKGERKAQILLADEKSAEEIAAEIESFQKRFGKNAVVVILPEDSDLCESFIHPADSADDDSR